MEIDFGECLNATFVVIQSSILEFQMRLLIRFKKRPRVVQIGNHQEWGVAEGEEEVMAQMMEVVEDVAGVVAGLVGPAEVEAVDAKREVLKGYGFGAVILMLSNSCCL